MSVVDRVLADSRMDCVLPIIAAAANRARGVWPLEPRTVDAATWIRCCGGSSVMGRVEGAMYAIATAPEFRIRTGAITDGELDALIGEMNQSLEATETAEKLAVFDAAVLVGVYAASVHATRMNKVAFDRFLSEWIKVHLSSDPLLGLSKAEGRTTTGYMRPPSAYAELLMTRACLQQTHLELFEGGGMRMRRELWPQLASNCPRWLIAMLTESGVDAKHLRPMWRYYFGTCLRLHSLLGHGQLDVLEWLSHSPRALLACSKTTTDSPMRIELREGFKYLVRRMPSWKAPVLTQLRCATFPPLDKFCADLHLLVKEEEEAAGAKKTTGRFTFAQICEYDGLALEGRPTPEPKAHTVMLFRALAPQCMMMTSHLVEHKDLVICHQSTVPHAFLRVFVFLLRCLNSEGGEVYGHQGERRQHVHEKLLAGAPVVLIPCVAAMCAQVALAEQGRFDHRRLQNVVRWVIEDLAAYIAPNSLAVNIPPIMQLELIRQQFCDIHDALFAGQQLPAWYMSNRVAILMCARWAPAWCYQRLLQPHHLNRKKKRGRYAIHLSAWDLAGAMVDQLRLQFVESPSKWFKGWFEPNQATFVTAIKDIISPAWGADHFFVDANESYEAGRLPFWMALNALLDGLPREGWPDGLSQVQYTTQVLPFFQPMHAMYGQEFARMQQEEAQGKRGPTRDEAASILDAALVAVHGQVGDAFYSKKHTRETGQMPKISEEHRGALMKCLTSSGGDDDEIMRAIIAHAKAHDGALVGKQQDTVVFISNIRKGLAART